MRIVMIKYYRKKVKIMDGTPIEFYKMQGAGNDYIYVDCFDLEIPDPGKLSEKISDRHFGIGGDGLVLILPSEKADAKMRMFNADGSEGKMCGNAIRCVGKYLYEIRGIKRKVISVETLSGIKTLYISEENGKVKSVSVDMGKAVLDPKKIPVLAEGESVINRPLLVCGKQVSITCVSMGNPHCVTFDYDPDALDIEKVGKEFENNPLFPERVNTEFIKVIAPRTVKMRVWERGSGETLACGTGACAAVVAAVLNGYCPMGENVKVILPGGELYIVYKADCGVTLTGGAEFVFKGTINV